MEENKILNTLKNSYGIKSTKLELLRKGGCVSYVVWSENEKFLLKVIPPVFIDTAKQSLDILLYLEQKEFPAPYIVLTKDGLPYVEADKTFLVLFNFIDGHEPDEGEDIEKIGTLVGQLHCIMKDYTGSLPEHGKEFFIERYLNILNKKNYNKYKIKIFREYGDILWKRVENLPRGFCHGDLHRGNLLKTSSGKIYIFDFDTSCFAFPVYDIVTMCNSTNYFVFDESGYQKSKNTYESFLKGYTKLRPLTNVELKAFYDLIAIYHYQLQATIIEINGLDCVNEKFLDKQLDWLIRWCEQCDKESN